MMDLTIRLGTLGNRIALFLSILSKNKNNYSHFADEESHIGYVLHSSHGGSKEMELVR